MSNKKIADLKRLHRSLRDKHQANRVKAVNIETLEPTVRFDETINAQSAMDLFRRLEAKHPEAKEISAGIGNTADRKVPYSSRLETGKSNCKEYRSLNR